MIGPGGFKSGPKKLTEAQRKQRLLYGSQHLGKRDEKRVSEVDALKRATGKRG
jgi:hypothetical protein